MIDFWGANHRGTRLVSLLFSYTVHQDYLRDLLILNIALGCILIPLYKLLLSVLHGSPLTSSPLQSSLLALFFFFFLRAFSSLESLVPNLGQANCNAKFPLSIPLGLCLGVI